MLGERAPVGHLKMCSTLESIRQWYNEVAPSYAALGMRARVSFEDIARASGIGSVTVTSRVKSFGSVAEKVQRKGYADPAQVTDILGVRIVTQTESDAQTLWQALQFWLEIPDGEQANRAAGLDPDRVGYRGWQSRCRLKYAPRDGAGRLYLELQVRSVLQHAWDEISHRLLYKLEPTLPAQIRRRVFLISGMLEVADREFNAAVDEAIAEFQHGPASYDPAQPIELRTLRECIIRRGSEILRLPPTRRDVTLDTVADICIELQRFGLTTVGEVDGLLTPTCVEWLKKEGYHYGNPIAVSWDRMLIEAMIFADYRRYFCNVWQGTKFFVHIVRLRYWFEQFGSDNFIRFIGDHGLEITQTPTTGGCIIAPKGTIEYFTACWPSRPHAPIEPPPSG